MTTQTIYKGHNSPFAVRITDYDGTAYTVARMATITRAYVKYIYASGQTAGYLDSAASGHEDVFDWATLAATGYLIIDGGLVGLTAGRDTTAELVIYDTAYPAGRMVTLIDILVDDSILGPLTLVDPIPYISIGDLSDVDLTGGVTGDVLTQQEDGTFKPAAPTGGGTTEVADGVTITGTGTISDPFVAVGGGGGTVILSQSLSTNLSYSGIVDAVTVGESVVFGQLLYHNLVDGKWYLATGGTTAAELEAEVMALGSATDGNSVTVLRMGYIRNDAWDWTVDGSRKKLFVSTSTSGAIIEDPAAVTAGQYTQTIGTINSADTIFFNPGTYFQKSNE